jgi:glycosyltransferase involved in cell wall biosynthesis
MLGKRSTGLGVYSKNCVEAIEANFDASYFALDSNLVPEDKVLSCPQSIAIGSGRLAAIKRYFWSKSVRIDEADVLYTPTHHGLIGVRDQVVTVHDLIALRHPSQHFIQFVYFKFFLPRLLRKCKAVFTVSECTKKDIALHYNYPGERIFVVPNGVDVGEFAPVVAVDSSPFLLVVGGGFFHKNVHEILENHELWSDKFRLVIVSASGKYRKYLARKAVELGIAEQVEFMGYVSRLQLVGLYSSCAAFIYPSKWEGFGIPPLEAISCGRKVVVSDIEVHREILADSVRYVRLGDRQSWIAAFTYIEKAELSDLEIKSRAQVLQQYSLENARKILVEKLHEVYPSLSEVN